MMLISLIEAARRLGERQQWIRGAVNAGILESAPFRDDIGVYEFQVEALRRMVFEGSRWDEATQDTVLDLLAGLPVSSLDGGELRKLRTRLRATEEAELAGQFLVGRVTLCRANVEQHRRIDSAKSGVQRLSGVGLSVIATRSARVEIERYGLERDPEGDVVLVDGAARHQIVLEAFAYVVYGNKRERSSGRKWLIRRRREAFE